MLNLNSILIGSENPKKLIAFYKKVLAIKPEWEDDEWAAFAVGEGYISIGPHSEVKGRNKEPGRLLINFQTTKVEKEFLRIEKLGARVIAKPYQPEQDQSMWIATFADPDGNYFQLMTPMKQSN